MQRNRLNRRKLVCFVAYTHVYDEADKVWALRNQATTNNALASQFLQMAGEQTASAKRSFTDAMPRRCKAAPPFSTWPIPLSPKSPIRWATSPRRRMATRSYLHWRFFDAFGLLTYETLPFYYFDEALAFKGQSGAETYFFGGYDSSEGCNVPGLILMGYRWYNPSIGGSGRGIRRAMTAASTSTRLSGTIPSITVILSDWMMASSPGTR